MNDVYKMGSAKYCGFDIQDKDALQTRVYIQKNNEALGFFSFSNEYRSELKKVVDSLNDYKLSLITGDNESEREKLLYYFG